MPTRPQAHKTGFLPTRRLALAALAAYDQYLSVDGELMRVLLFAATLGFVAGCGLSDYEKRMDEQRARLELHDEEAKLLSDIIEMPRGKDAYGNEIKVPFDIFLRFPRPVTSTFRGPKAIYHGGNKQPLYRYEGKTDMNVLVALAKVASSKDASPKDKAPEGEEAPEDFRTRVREAIMDYISREYRMSATPPEFTELKKDVRQTTREGRPHTLEFETIVFDDPRRQEPSRFFVFFHTQKYRQAVVIYQVPAQQANDKAALHALDISLKTLEILPAATGMRMAFRARK